MPSRSSTTTSACTPTARSTSPCGEAALDAGRTIKLRIHVTGLDAMCRMIENGLGIGVMPGHAFELMRGGIGRRLTSVALSDPWARREIRLVARDFSTLPVAARSLVAHLQASGAANEGLALAA
jgi:DNA-binding transcriptional LysR family regulator